MNRSRVVGSLVVLPFLLMLAVPALGQPAAMKWPDAVAQLTAQRTRAENCVALLKRYGDKDQVVQGQLVYTNAKADSDAVIAGLITALSTGQEPASLSSLQTTMNSGISGLAELCNRVGKLVPGTEGQKGGLAEILANLVLSPAVIEQTLKMISAGVSTLYGDYRADDALTRGTIKTQLEAARWPAFTDVKPAD